MIFCFITAGMSRSLMLMEFDGKEKKVSKKNAENDVEIHVFECLLETFSNKNSKSKESE
jgi:hypothetical protein